MSYKNTDLIFDKAAKISAEQLGENISLDNDVEVPEINSEMLYKKATKNKTSNKIAKLSRLAACIAFAVIIISGISIYSVDAWRADFMKFFYKEENINTDIYFGRFPNSYTASNIKLNYIPENFETDKFERDDKKFIVSFKNKNESFTFKFTKLNKGKENIKGETFKINGMTATFNNNTLVWKDRKYEYTITGTISKEEMIKIAENAEKPEL